MSLVLGDRGDSQEYRSMEKGVKRKREDREDSQEYHSMATATATATAEAAAWEAKSLYVFVWNSSGPMVHSLYAIDIPNPFPDPRPPSSEPEQEPLSPILDFPRGEYPSHMCCVALDSKFYFFGGGNITDEYKEFFPCDVHILDISSAASEKSRCPTLTRGPKMNTGKVEPIAFVHDGKIYVLSGSAETPRGLILKQFEVLVGVNNGGGGKWIELQAPPFVGDLIYGHVVVNRRVFVLTLECGLWCLLLDSLEWHKISGCRGELDYGAVFVEDTFYCSYTTGVISYRPLWTSSTSKEEEDEELALLSEGNMARFDIEPRLPKGLHHFPYEESELPTRSIRHIGKRRFCHVLHWSPLLLYNLPPGEEYPNLLPGQEYQEARCLTLTMFEDLKDTYTIEENTFFKAKVLHSAHFIFKTPDTLNSHISECVAL